MAQHWTNSATTTLNGGITNSATSLTVNTGDGALFPSTGPFRIRIDNEVIEVGSRSTDTFSSLTRGAEGSAASHSSGAAVKGILTAGQLAMFHQVGVAELTDADFVTPPAMKQIQAITVGSGGSATIDFTSIPGTYNHLRLEFMLRATGSGTAVDWVDLKINNDTGANYDEVFNQETTTSQSGGAATSTANGKILLMPQGGCTAGAVVKGVIEIPGYADTHFWKVATCQAALYDNSNAGTRVVLHGLTWHSTSAVTQLTLVPEADTFAQFSAAYLYGVS